MMGRLWAGFASLILLMSFSLVGFSAEKNHIGFVDAQKVLDETQAGKRAKDSFDEYTKSREKLIELDEKELLRLEEEFSKQAGVLSPEAKRAKQEDFKIKLEKLQKNSFRSRREIQEKFIELTKEFKLNLRNVLKKVAEKDGYLLILDNSSEGDVLFYEPENDLTQQVIEEYDKIFD